MVNVKILQGNTITDRHKETNACTHIQALTSTYNNFNSDKSLLLYMKIVSSFCMQNVVLMVTFYFKRIKIKSSAVLFAHIS